MLLDAIPRIGGELWQGLAQLGTFRGQHLGSLGIFPKIDPLAHQVLQSYAPSEIGGF